MPPTLADLLELAVSRATDSLANLLCSIAAPAESREGPEALRRPLELAGDGMRWSVRVQVSHL